MWAPPPLSSTPSSGVSAMGLASESPTSATSVASSGVRIVFPIVTNMFDASAMAPCSSLLRLPSISSTFPLACGSIARSLLTQCMSSL
ncbi:hypothetical protein K466DRAFT_588710 [Polyporus arcularius HHB13444]|uniref:Uncharacterized protein n=1 Tax=Polyporus arcularius HHB13444 TaxID=1314778 RepID=A0A5C3P633_9APHY|nr:hypothetical protein K466DRAFT_588710 [Polyporus arcularius HHB13444]